MVRLSMTGKHTTITITQQNLICTIPTPNFIAINIQSKKPRNLINKTTKIINDTIQSTKRNDITFYFSDLLQKLTVFWQIKTLVLYGKWSFNIMFITAQWNQKLNGTLHVLAHKPHTGKTDYTWNSHMSHTTHRNLIQLFPLKLVQIKRYFNFKSIRV
jgi:hypothetical protein